MQEYHIIKSTDDIVIISKTFRFPEFRSTEKNVPDMWPYFKVGLP